MKRKIIFTLLVFFLLVLSVYSFVNTYYDTENADIERMQQIEPEINQTFFIPENEFFSRPHSWEKVYPLLQKSANETKVNLFRTSAGYSLDNKREIHQFILLTDETIFFNRYFLHSGRFMTLEESNREDSFLSTADTGSKEQVGVLKKFGKDPIIQIQPLTDMQHYLPLTGKYFVESVDDQHFEKFVNRFVTLVNEQFSQEILQPYALKDFIQEEEAGQPLRILASDGGEFFQELQIIYYLLYIIVIVLLVYYCYNMNKEVGIMKMQGVSSIRVWYRIIGRFIITLYLLTTVSFVIFSLGMKILNYTFLKNIILSQCLIYSLILGSSFIVYFYIIRVKISDAIKNRKHTTNIFLMNTFLKVIGSVFLMFLILLYWQSYELIKIEEDRINHWEKNQDTDDYGVFYPLKTAHTILETGPNITTDYLTSSYLYPYLNARGALFINATQYDQDILHMPLESGTIRFIQINPNFLQKQPIYTSSNKPVEVSESMTDRVLLVPKKHIDKEEEIRKHFQDLWSNIIETTQRNNFSISENLLEQKLTIIWTENQQRVFSFDPNVFPQEDNEIVDPIVEVLTENNTVLFDYLGFISGEEASAVKVPLIDRNPALTMQEMKPELEEIGIYDQLNSFVEIDATFDLQKKSLQKQMKKPLFYMLCLFILSSFMLVQSVTILFTKYEKKFIVRRLFGFGFLRTYREYLLFFVGGWAMILVICLTLSMYVDIGDSVSSKLDVFQNLLSIGSVMFAMELAISILFISRLERQKLAQALKEG